MGHVYDAKQRYVSAQIKSAVKVNTEAVCLNSISYGMKPDGYEIYRRNAGNKKFTLLAVTKKSVSSINEKSVCI